jgi:hypothetical protein
MGTLFIHVLLRDSRCYWVWLFPWTRNEGVKGIRISSEGLYVCLHFHASIKVDHAWCSSSHICQSFTLSTYCRDLAPKLPSSVSVNEKMVKWKEPSRGRATSIWLPIVAVIRV